jgi:hypothetical protein
MRRRTKVAGWLGATLAVGALCAPLAGAEDWTPPDHAVDLLSPAYRSAEGHTASVSAICSGTDAIEVAIHPWDMQARNFQVYALDGFMLVNVTAARWSQVIPLADHPARILYNGDSPFQLVTDRCAAPVATVPPPATQAPVITVPPPTITYPPLIPPISIVAPPVQKSGGIDEPSLGLAVAGVYAERPAVVPETLPITGGPEGLLLAVGALGIGIPLTAATRKARKAQR